MAVESFNQLFGGGALQRDGLAQPKLSPRRLFDRRTVEDANELRGKVQSARGAPNAPARFSKGLDQRLGNARRVGFRKPAKPTAGFDLRQRAVVKVHYFTHAGGGGAALGAHTRYVAREAAALDAPAIAASRSAENADKRNVFYSADLDRVDGAALTGEWAMKDRRHFRIILAAEMGADLKDLKAYTREVMARADAALGARLSWVAVDHWDTDNPHTHIILRGRTADGRALFLPKDFIKQGFRDIAREVATERLGVRTRDKERVALAREARAHRPSRLDAHLERRLDAEGRLRIAGLSSPGGDPSLTAALKLRAKELARLGLAQTTVRNVLHFESDWRDRLKAMEIHLDIRKRVVAQRRLTEAALSAARLLGKGPDR
jgi:type IV secretory pathway VirD2 relaxase